MTDGMPPRIRDVKGARDSSQGGEQEERQDSPSCQRGLCSERMMSWAVSDQPGRTLGTLRESPAGRWSPSLDPRNMVGGGGLCPRGCCLLRGAACMGPSTLLSRPPPALIFSGPRCSQGHICLPRCFLPSTPPHELFLMQTPPEDFFFFAKLL